MGEVLRTLQATGTADNTLVVFTSDNGGMLNRGGQEAWRQGHRMNADLLGFKFDVWEGGHRVPFIARWPGHIEAGSESDALISNVDLLTTTAALLDQPLAADEGLDSFNLLPVLSGSTDTEVRDHMLYAPQRKSHVGLRQGDWVYIPVQGHGGFGGKNVGDHTLGGPAAHRFTGHVNSDIENGKIREDAPPAQLYHLSEDPSQAVNVIRQHPEIAEQMEVRLAQVQAGPTAPHSNSPTALIAPPQGWKWDRPVPAHTKSIPEGLALRTEPGRIWAGEGNRNRLISIKPVGPDSTVQASVELVNAVAKWEQCGLLLYRHDDAFVKLVIEHIDGRHYLVMARETPADRQVLAQIDIDRKGAELKLQVSKQSVSGFWRASTGDAWQLAAESELPEEGEARFGVFTQDGDPNRPRFARVQRIQLSE